MAEGARLESVFTRKGNVGSNPTLSARTFLKVSRVEGKKENTVSQDNGDKARFSRERKKKALKRKTNRELKKTLGMTKPPKAA